MNPVSTPPPVSRDEMGWYDLNEVSGPFSTSFA